MLPLADDAFDLLYLTIDELDLSGSLLSTLLQTLVPLPEADHLFLDPSPDPYSLPLRQLSLVQFPHEAVKVHLGRCGTSASLLIVIAQITLAACRRFTLPQGLFQACLGSRGRLGRRAGVRTVSTGVRCPLLLLPVWMVCQLEALLLLEGGDTDLASILHHLEKYCALQKSLNVCRLRVAWRGTLP